jgi:hypothetical protein
MADNSLRVIVRLRQLALDQAREKLAACPRTEEAADQAVQEAKAARRRERWAAADLPAGGQPAESFVNWSEGSRKAQEDAATGQTTAAANTTKARAELSAARAAREAAETILSARESERKAAAERREQLALEEMARRRREEDEARAIRDGARAVEVLNTTITEQGASPCE